jgi:hypothetical protein
MNLTRTIEALRRYDEAEYKTDELAEAADLSFVRRMVRQFGEDATIQEMG